MARYLPAIFAALCVVLLAAPVSATVIGGGVTSGSGSFVKLTVPFTDSDPDNTVGNNTFQNPNLYAFDEEQNINITSEIFVDVGTNPNAGDIVASHYVFFDPVNASQEGFVDFDADIFGVATNTANLSASDFLANTGVNYLNPTLRGLESGDAVAIDSSNPQRLLVDWTASTPGDYVRVFTMESPGAGPPPVPLPSTLSLLLAALAGTAYPAMKRRR